MQQGKLTHAWVQGIGSSCGLELGVGWLGARMAPPQPPLAERLGGTVEITEAELDALGERHGCIRRVGVLIERTPAGGRGPTRERGFLGGGRPIQLLRLVDRQSVQTAAIGIPPSLLPAKLFGLIEGPPSRIVTTSRAQKILYAVDIGGPKQALIDAFLAVPLYAAIYKEYSGKELPPKFGLKNALRTMFEVTPGRIDEAYRAFIASAETSGFFEVRGSKTQLLMPMVPAGFPRQTPPPEDEPGGEEGVVGGGGGPGGGDGSRPPTKPKSTEELKNEYLSTLIGVLRERGSKGEIDDALMQRIEKLLGLPE